MTFNDERRFCVNRADRRERGWRGPGEERECHGLTDVSYDYRTSLVSINGHLNAQRRSSSCCSMWQCLFSSGCYCRHSVPARQCSYSRQRSCSNTTSCVAMTSELTSSQPNERFVIPSGAESILPGAFCSHRLTISDQRPAYIVQTLLITADSSATFESVPHLTLSSSMSSAGISVFLTMPSCSKLTGKSMHTRCLSILVIGLRVGGDRKLSFALIQTHERFKIMHFYWDTNTQSANFRVIRFVKLQNENNIAQTKMLFRFSSHFSSCFTV